MKVYWDSSALILALHEEKLLRKINKADHATRVHALAEIFCTLTKGVGYRYAAEDAARLVESLAASLTLVELGEAETLGALKRARKLGVRGARVHDLMHVAGAEKIEAEMIFTLDRGGFSDLAGERTVEHPMTWKW